MSNFADCIIGALFLTGAILPSMRAAAQDASVFIDPSIAGFRRSALDEQVMDPQKALPPGFHHFIEIPHQLRIQVSSRGGDLVLCRRMENAISFGKRIGLGFSAPAAVRYLKGAWFGDGPCEYADPGLRLRPVAYAVRGDDTGKPIFIMRLTDQNGQDHFTGVPKRF